MIKSRWAEQRNATFLQIICFVVLLRSPIVAGDPSQRFVYPGSQGRLVYDTDARGNQILDFSRAGYRSSDMPLPVVPSALTLTPLGDERDQAALQSALVHLASRPLNEEGFRGALQLSPGTFVVQRSLIIPASGIVIRGASQGTTCLEHRGIDRAPVIKIVGEASRWSDASELHDAYVPVGSRTVHVVDASKNWKAGMRVRMNHPSTRTWIAALEMDRFPTDEKGSWLDWRPGSMDLHVVRKIERVEDDAITFDAPLPFPIDVEQVDATIAGETHDGTLQRIGIEHLSIRSRCDSPNEKCEDHAWDGIWFDRARDCWVREVAFEGLAGSAVGIGDGGQCISVVYCQSQNPKSEDAAYRRRTFWNAGQQNLFAHCQAEQGRNDFCLGYVASGPNVFTQCTAKHAHSMSGPLESAVHGALFDCVSIDGGRLALTNREIDGQGVGWAALHCVLWQCVAPIIECRNPPQSHNYALGCWGGFLGNGHWRSMNEFVQPKSLFQQQLEERIGKEEADAVVGSWKEMISMPTTSPNSPVVSLATRPSKPSPKQILEQRNGWLMMDDQMATGTRASTQWWRGSTNPQRYAEFGFGITRFVPGHYGAGATDEVDQVATKMRSQGIAVLDHHWGLWYERRRDDHEMIRRIDSEVWGPFYEQPWARSGKGTAWDGLSLYDLKQFNPWYFDRLRSFASACEERGTILWGQMYFQHNILEAGAHWVDFPWRSANCLQETGFEEPPPFVGGKRIFQADAFYDVGHPVRRSLHRAYIEHYLENLADRSNVVISIGEEFTGPASFVRFWLETIADWKVRHPDFRPKIALSCTQDVQDVVLKDTVLSALIDIIELKYWWYMSDGSRYAPEGGKNLAPRQQLREWKGKKSRSDVQTARQLKEMRLQYPNKAIVTHHVPQYGASIACSGGSLSSHLPESIRNLPWSNLQLIDHPNQNFYCVSNRSDCWIGIWYPENDDALSIELPATSAPLVLHRLDPKSGIIVESQNIDTRPTLSIPSRGHEACLLWITTQTNQEPR
ncbi:MAG: DUF6298 domain-containing protein [Pirellulales bacterium]